MAFYTQILLVFAISFFLATLSSEASYNYPNSYSQSPSPALSLEESDTASASASSSSSMSSSLSTPLTTAVSSTTFEIPKNIAIASTGDVSIFVKATMDATMAKTDEFITKVIDKRLADPKLDIYAKDCLETCKYVFEDAVDAMKRTEEDVKAGNYYKANVDVSAMSTNIDTCNECATSIYGDDPVFTKFENWAQGIASDCLAKITGQSS
uniref:PGPS/D7 n=1 Tax=Petunia hybrida TaxID=4102 RepID=Q9ZNX3_PETHY|nr:PGPS/D7 [Petunia x hybrida]